VVIKQGFVEVSALERTGREEIQPLVSAGRDRPVCMVLEHVSDYPSEWAVIEFIAPKIGCLSQTLHS